MGRAGRFRTESQGALLWWRVGDALVACLGVYISCILAWLYSELLHRGSRKGSTGGDDGDEEAEGKALLPVVAENGEVNGATAAAAAEGNSVPELGKEVPQPSKLYHLSSSALFRCLQLDREALISCRLLLRCVVELGTILLWFYVADRTPAIAAGEKTYSRDLFLFLFVVLTAVAAGYTLRASRGPVLLHRHQTEEWKGWMQVLFLLYHYYNAKEAYNAIRVFIAAYVWMTGFGNFAYYYKTADFSLGRFVQMMWRLNFLVIFCCLVLNNSYMLYYICPMHTIFTVLVYAALGIGWQYNKTQGVIWAKVAASFAVVFLFWDVKPVFDLVWSPFAFFMGYVDPRRPGPEPMHEWYFRSSLDRYIWIWGMVCAYVHPTWDKFLQRVDSMQPALRRAVRAGMMAGALLVGYVWYTHVYTLPKLEYNKLHPYTSWIPITVFIVLRNMTPPLRLWSMSLYGWLGCITLETYIGQFHTWMVTKADDGQPIYLLVLLPGYPLLNFALVTAIYVILSYRLFHVTNDLKLAVVPHDDNRLLLRNAVVAAVAGTVVLGGAFLVTQARDLFFLS
ncbi:hypothetical protein N2152v2_005610 [Parachlorella kessleri]